MAVDKYAPDNNYTNLGIQGRFLTFVENVPVVDDLLKSLGPNREKLYKAVVTAKSEDDRLCRALIVGEE